MKFRYSLTVCLLSFSALCAGLNSFASHPPHQFNNETISVDKYYRTELYFGRSKPDGSMVNDEDWNRFLNDVVTPRFPDGFTVLDGTGQYRDKAGRIIKEPSKVLIFLYSRKNRKTSSARIDEIRAEYVKLFSQESVLRMDFQKSIIVLF
jgi:Protein of unknown function (DUF3574).